MPIGAIAKGSARRIKSGAEFKNQRRAEWRSFDRKIEDQPGCLKIESES
jgi:hypothetical protein